MSTILEVIEPARHARPKRAPTLRVQCACGRIYLARCWEREVREQRRCKACIATATVETHGVRRARQGGA